MKEAVAKFPEEHKIRRARFHIENLRTTINSFLKKKPFRLIAEQFLIARYRILRVEQLREIDPDIPLILGDAIHNLRSALDLVVYSLVSATVEDAKLHLIQFPFARSEKNLEEKIRQAQITSAGDALAAAVAELRPYQGGNVLLWGLHELDVIDKHRLILTTSQGSSIVPDLMAQNDPALAGRISGSGRWGSPDGVYAIIPFDRLDQEIGHQEQPPERWPLRHQPDFTLVFAEGPFAGSELQAKMNELATEVMRACASLRAAR